MSGGLLLASVLTALLGGFQSAPPADLASARTLYAAASYEEALALLDRVPNRETLEPVYELRALCLLALGRTIDAEQTMATLVMRNPGYELSQTDVSPKLVALFRNVRRATLPVAARASYERAKTSYDNKLWSDAAAGFTALLALLKDPDAAAAQADLKQLTEGFLALSQGEIAAAERRAADALAADNARKAREAATEQTARDTAATAAAAPPGSAPSSTRPPAPTLDVYSADDVDVTAPVEVRRVMPRWMPPTPAMAQAAHRGTLELIIDESGGVVSARVTKPIAPSYDQALRDLARSWRYRPATRGGRPVRYRHVLEIVLRPAQ